MITGHTKRRVAEATSYQIMYHVEPGIKKRKTIQKTREKQISAFKVLSSVRWNRCTIDKEVQLVQEH